jgi:hypothetical protein
MTQVWSLAESEDKKVREFVQGGYGQYLQARATS